MDLIICFKKNLLLTDLSYTEIGTSFISLNPDSKDQSSAKPKEIRCPVSMISFSDISFIGKFSTCLSLIFLSAILLVILLAQIYLHNLLVE